jgi:hypothetical protein
VNHSERSYENFEKRSAKSYKKAMRKSGSSRNKAENNYKKATGKDFDWGDGSGYSRKAAELRKYNK